MQFGPSLNLSSASRRGGNEAPTPSNSKMIVGRDPDEEVDLDSPPPSLQVKSYSHRMTSADQWKAYAAQLIYSPLAKYYYIFMCVVTVFEVGVTLADPHQAPHTLWFMALELFMVAMLMNEVTVRFIADGYPGFFRSQSNLFDLVVAVICMVTAVMLLAAPSILTGVQDWIPVTILRVRDMLRLLRLVFLIKNHRKAAMVGQSVMNLRVDQTDLEAGMTETFVFDSPGSHPMDHTDLGNAVFRDHVSSDHPPPSPSTFATLPPLNPQGLTPLR